MPSKSSYVDVAVFAAVPGLLTYKVPEAFLGEASPGRGVFVPLKTRRAKGIIIGESTKLHSSIKARAILGLWGDEAILPDDLLKLGVWISKYYLSPPGEVFRSMIPLQKEVQERWMLRISPKGKVKLKYLTLKSPHEGKDEKELKVLKLLSQHQKWDSRDLQIKVRGLTKPFLIKLVKAGMIESQHVQFSRKTREMKWYGLPSSRSMPTSKVSVVERRILHHLQSSDTTIPQGNLLKATKAKTSHLKRLLDDGLILLFDKPSDSQMANGIDLAKSNENLSSDQEKVFNKIKPLLTNDKFRVMLLHGVTGSGKTEIYLRSIEKVLSKGRSVLILVPEISLTPAMHMLFQDRFAGKVALLHSSLRRRERELEWKRARRGEAQVVLGTRSAALAPVVNLGLIVVDEEHDASYKQQTEPRYHGRDVVIVRARRKDIPVLLGSATPSLESYWNASRGKYELLKLPERIAGRPMAAVEIQDMRNEFKETHSAIPISNQLKNNLKQEFSRKSQVMILVNRRGYAWFLLCRSCGHCEGCKNCSIALTYHRGEHCLICHYCGYKKSVLRECSSCGSKYLHFVGAGTEKLMELLQTQFPHLRIGRLDRDIAQKKGEYQRVLTRFKQGKLDLLVGTQMIAKGHDFPGVTLVGVIAADAGLRFPDFRAAERVFQLLTQSAGRAGRASEPGKVIVQAFYPEHYAVQTAARQDYRAFYEKEIRFRRIMHYPPFTALANLVIRHSNKEKAKNLATSLGQHLEPLCDANSALRLLGPGPAPFARLHNYYRMQFILKCTNRNILNYTLVRLLEILAASGWPRKALAIDVDPVDLM